MSFVHIEIVTGEYVSVYTGVNAEKIHGLLSCFGVCNDLFISRDVL